MFKAATAVATMLALAAVLMLTAQTAEASKLKHDGVTIFYDGIVKKGDAKKLRKMMDDTGIRIVNLDSGGGHATEGFELGYLFQEYEVHATVAKGDRCMSSCANALLGAPTHDLKGLLGFHVAWTTGKGDASAGMRQGQQYAVISALYNSRVGYGMYFQYLIASYTDKDTMLILSSDDLLLLKLKEDEDFLARRDLPKGWIAQRIAGATRIYALTEDI